jgi:ATP adenylyltransferase
VLERGTLWEKLTRTTNDALRSGALRPIPTDFEFIEDGDVRFLVRVVTNLARKQHARIESAGDSGQRANPFLPYDREMYVADASESHVCLLNKFNVLDHHLLIVTRRFEHQLSPLNQADFEALWACMSEYDSLGFYNSGAIAGASQPHKHLQLVPLPMALSGAKTPVEPLIESASYPGDVGQAERLPFRHALARLDPDVARSPSEAAQTTHSLYRRMLGFVGIEADLQNCDRLEDSYNLLLTRQWMLLVPRSRERFESISLNALAFAGALLVRDERQMAALRNHGPMAALKQVAYGIEA